MSQDEDSTITDKVIKKVVSGEGAATATGAAVGGWFGSSMGIAAFGTAVSGLLPVAAVGAGAFYLGYKAIKYKNRANELKRELKEEYEEE